MSDEHEHTHRYGDHEETSRIPQSGYETGHQPGSDHTAQAPVTPTGDPASPAAPPASPFFSTATDEPEILGGGRTATRSRGRSRTAGILAAALLLGGAGGIGGAYGFDLLNGDGTPSGTASASSSPLATASSTSSAAPAAAGSPEAVAADVLPSVVKINVSGATESGSGSGIILTADGEILTNNHVVAVAANGGKISVNFNDGSTADATIVGTDPVTDLAVIKAKGVSGQTPAQLGDSDQLQVGQGVVAIGSPFGLDATVTSGIVSSLNRPVSVSTSDSSGPTQAGGDSTTYLAIQTDAAINPGNSGGPLVNLAGQVVGINSSIRSSASSGTSQGGSIGLGFSIPISKVLPVVDQMRKGETPTHARLGVTVSTKQGSDGLTLGAGIESVTAGSAGAQAGLKSGDVVTKVDDETITDVDSLVATIRAYRPGDTVTLTVDRGNSTETLKATLDSDVTTSSS